MCITMIPRLQELQGLVKHVPDKRLRKLGNGRNRSEVPYEAILVDQHVKSANCNTFVTSRHRIVPWILAFSEYFASCNTTTRVSYTWYNEDSEVSIKAGCITKLILQVSPSSAPDKRDVTITIFLKTGLVMIQGSKFMDFGRDDFPKVKALVDPHVVKDKDSSQTIPLNSTSVSQSPGHAAAALSPGVSPIKETESEDEQDSDSEKEENGTETSLHEQTILSNTLSLACGNIDRNISDLKDRIVKKSNDNAGVLKKLETQTQTISMSSQEIKQKIQTMSSSHQKMEKEIVTITSSNNTMKKDIAQLKMDVAKILDIVTVIREEGIPKKSEKKDAATMTVKFSSDGKPIHEVPKEAGDAQKSKDLQTDKTNMIKLKTSTENGTVPSSNSKKPERTASPNPSDTDHKWSFVRDSTPYVNENTEKFPMKFHRKYHHFIGRFIGKFIGSVNFIGNFT